MFRSKNIPNIPQIVKFTKNQNVSISKNENNVIGVTSNQVGGCPGIRTKQLITLPEGYFCLSIKGFVRSSNIQAYLWVSDENNKRIHQDKVFIKQLIPNRGFNTPEVKLYFCNGIPNLRSSIAILFKNSEMNQSFYLESLTLERLLETDSFEEPEDQELTNENVKNMNEMELSQFLEFYSTQE